MFVLSDAGISRSFFRIKRARPAGSYEFRCLRVSDGGQVRVPDAETIYRLFLRVFCDNIKILRLVAVPETLGLRAYK